MSATTGTLSSTTTTPSLNTPTSSNTISSSSSGTSSHHRTHSRNISIGGAGKSIAKLNDYCFSYISASAKSSSKPKQTTTVNHRGPTLKTTKDLLQFYKSCNPDFSYVSSLNPRRVLTHPSEGVYNDGYDNANSDYIIYVNDIIGSEFNQRYKVLDTLGQGTFGQVVKCQNCDTNELVAVKILKNKNAYFQQGKLEIDILKKLNNQYDPENKSNILRLLDSFIYRKHLCIVFELLSVNLFELIKQNSFRGLSTNLIKVFLIQILDALIVLSKANMIHCDLKPENILLQSVNSPNLKLIDFGSACYENQTIYTYIQSRHYRSPEVLVGLQYTSSIDMWSLGCISAELFLGLPLFPGTSEYNQICRIVEMRGMFSNEMVERGKNSSNYFKQSIENGKIIYRLKTDEEYQKDSSKVLEPPKKYFNYKLLPDIIQNYGFKKNLTPQEIEKEKQNRIVFTDFVSGLLNLDPNDRWSPMQAREHPFITGSTFSGPFIPDPAKKLPFHSTAPKPISSLNAQNHSFNNSNTSSFGKRVPVLPPFKHSLGGESAYFPESYSPRSLYGSFSNQSLQSSQLALGQSPSMFGTPSSMFPPQIPYSPHGYGYGSWGGSDGLPPPPNSSIYQQQQNSRRGRSKSDAPNSNGNDLLPNNHNNSNNMNNNMNSNNMIGLDDQYGNEEKPPIYPLNSPQRKRSQSGLVPMDNPYQYIPRMHLDHWGSNRFRSHSYGEQFQSNQHPSKQQQQQQQQQPQLQQSPLQHSAPQIFDHRMLQQQQQQQRQQYQHHSQYSPPIPNSPQIQNLPLTPQLISQDPISPLMGSDSNMINWNPSPSEEMLFPFEQLLPSQQQTPQLTSQSNPLSKSTSSPVGSRFIPPMQNGWKMEDMNNNFNTMQLGGDQAGSWQPPSTSSWGIPHFSIQNEAPYDDPTGNMISYSPYTPNPMMFQSPPSNFNYSIKQSPPSRTFYNDMQSSSHGSYNSGYGGSGHSSNHPHSYSAPSKYQQQIPLHQQQQQQQQQQQLNQQSPPSSNFNNHNNNGGHPGGGNKPVKNGRPRNDAFSRTSPPSSRAHPQQSQQQQQQTNYQQSKPISLSQSFSQQSPSTPLSPNTPPFIPQSLNQPPPPTIPQLSSSRNNQQTYNQQTNSSNLINEPSVASTPVEETAATSSTTKQEVINNNQQQQQQSVNRKLLIGSYRDPITSSPPPP